MNIGPTFLTLCVLCATTLAQPLSIEGLSAKAPLTVSAAATTESLTVDIVMEPQWHLYSKDVGGGRPVSVTIEDGSHFTAAGALIIPEAEAGKLTGEFSLVLPLRRNGSGRAIVARFDFMACDPLMCLPPMSVTITGKARERVQRLKILLVVDQEDARSKRIMHLLGSHGLATTVSTYETVTTLSCDTHDVVLADSKLFRENLKGSRGRAIKFPRTSSPIIAVGFLGTELIEAHGIAMTSGYI